MHCVQDSRLRIWHHGPRAMIELRKMVVFWKKSDQNKSSKIKGPVVGFFLNLGLRMMVKQSDAVNSLRLQNNAMVLIGMYHKVML